MPDIPCRMTGLHQLLTGAPRQTAWRCSPPPRHLRGDPGLPEGVPHAPRRSLPARLWWRRGSGA